MLNAHWWAKCLPQENADTDLMRLDVEAPSSLPPRLWQIRQRQKAILRGCWNSGIIILGAILIGLSVSLIDRYVTVWSSSSSSSGESSERQRLEHFHGLFLASGSNSTVEEHLRELTKKPHVAGTAANFETAEYVKSVFEKYGLRAQFSDYEVLLSYPVERNLSLLYANGSLQQTFSLREEAVEGDSSTSDRNVIPTFHAYSPSGDVQAEVVYVNYGRDEDYEVLQRMGVAVRGAIVLARYGQIYRGDIVANAAKAGASAAIIYSDPAEYAANGKEGHYPDSRWLPSSGVQRGTVLESSGDPLTPGWPSTKSAERIDTADAKLPQIPSMPVSAQDALAILAMLGGPVASREWQGGLGIPAYKVGRGPGRLHFRYVANQTVAPIRNVLAVIRGYEESDRLVMLGNHRDAWTFGAVDPNSGTAALLEIACRLGKLVKRGWKPRRTIVLGSWDAEEYGLVGSTEWVEHNIDVLGDAAVAYLNVDCAVSGPGFVAAATPQLDDLLIDVAKKIKDPDSVHATLYDAWVAGKGSSSRLIGRLGDTGSDYAAFLQHAGVPAVDVYFGKSYPVYHSLYDNFNWMKEFGDPYFHRHVAVSSLWGLLALRLADSLILPFNYSKYADELESYVTTVEATLSTDRAPSNITIEPLREAVSEFLSSARQASEQAKSLHNGPRTLGRAVESSTSSSSSSLVWKRSFNDRLMLVERAFLDADGLPGRSWYKHLIYGPSKSNEYNTTAFPGILDSAAQARTSSNSSNLSLRWKDIQHQIFRVSRVVSRAAVVLRGELV